MTQKIMKGLNICNPVDADKEYMLYAVEYAHKHGFTHIQFNGPIHNPVKGNIDGMLRYRKYADFNGGKDNAYIDTSLDGLNAALDKAAAYGIKMYVWHHEVELPASFKEVHPEILNEYGDIELTHRCIADFLENKIADFFFYYPNAAGIVLTLHETSVPILKLKNQKLGKVERVKYITQILFDACKKAGKELIVRPFASIEEDYALMTAAYAQISDELIVMDKWTQFDWSLTLPNNAFFKKITGNPLLIEADIFGEFFGRDYIPLMLLEHIKEKVAYCQAFSPLGYVARIDRAGHTAFGNINEVNIDIFNACLCGEDPTAAAKKFFDEKFGSAGETMLDIMLKTEDILKKIYYLGGFYYNEQSFFPQLNHSKNHYYTEILRENGKIDSDEWFIPPEYKKKSLPELIGEKRAAVSEAEELCARFISLRGDMPESLYEKTLPKFLNLKYIARLWAVQTEIFITCGKFFDTGKSSFEEELNGLLETLSAINKEAKSALGDKYMCMYSAASEEKDIMQDRVEDFIDDLKYAFNAEKTAFANLKKDTALYDAVVCGSMAESHLLKKEVNFSDTTVTENGICRVAGTLRDGWCAVNAHGWFGYRVKINPHKKNIIKIMLGAIGKENAFDVRVTVGDEIYTFNGEQCRTKEIEIEYTPKDGENGVRIRFDKISPATPCVYTIKIYG